MYRYIAVIHKDSDSDYGVSFPDFPGCITAGSDIEDAGKMAYQVLPFHIRGMLEDGEKIPSPSTFEDIAGDPEYEAAVAFLAVSLPDPDTETFFAEINIPENAAYHPWV